ncbi:hypothetical protein ACLM5H_10360 [Fredinandcohnia humi]
MYYFNQEVTFLLMNESKEKVDLLYNTNETTFKLPVIGIRPPYYYNPRYEYYYPII